MDTKVTETALTIAEYTPDKNSKELLLAASGNVIEFVYTKNVLSVEDGRILPPDKSGDNVNWVEIARYGNYSLIVRSSYINWYTTSGYYGNAAWQYIPYGKTNDYNNSNVRTKINNWFNGANGVYGDNLGVNARLRRFTVGNNALSKQGTASDEAGRSNGYSLPTGTKYGTGSDIAFALSYCEAVNFISRSCYTWQNGDKVSPSVAQKNYTKISIPKPGTGINASGMWLRSPTSYKGVDYAGALTSVDGRAFQFYLEHETGKQQGYLYPALWVESAVFDADVTING
jgi:hypothetical protein